MNFKVEACSGRTGWDIEPAEELDIDVEELASRFDEVMVNTPHVIIVSIGGGEVSVYPDGSMFVKKVDDRETTEKIVEKVSDEIDRL